MQHPPVVRESAWPEMRNASEMITTLAILGQRYRLVRTDDKPVEAKAQIGLVPSREIPVYLEARK